MKGILFKPNMMQAAVEGRKSNTRRAEAGLKGINQNPDIWQCTKTLGEVFCFYNLATLVSVRVKPRYHVGETVYMKEAYCFPVSMDNLSPSEIYERYGAFERKYLLDGVLCGENPYSLPMTDGRVRSPLFMPEWAARHFITIEAVRAERVQEITYVDILAEGWSVTKSQPFTDRTAGEDAKDWFKELWNSINPKYPFESNPWVFPYTFERNVPEGMGGQYEVSRR